MAAKKLAIITGALGSIGAALADGFSKDRYKVAATARDANRKLTFSASMVLLDGDIGEQQAAAYAVEPAKNIAGSMDVLANNASKFQIKPFTGSTSEDFDALLSTNLLALFYVTLEI